jgi:hypothetical protein
MPRWINSQGSKLMTIYGTWGNRLYPYACAVYESGSWLFERVR